jgi:hypothetical protein
MAAPAAKKRPNTGKHPSGIFEVIVPSGIFIFQTLPGRFIPALLFPS